MDNPFAIPEVPAAPAAPVVPGAAPVTPAAEPDLDTLTPDQLKEQLKQAKADAAAKGENLAAQGKLIAKLKKEGSAVEFKAPHAEVKFSKDLTETERDAMTQQEIKLMDENATFKAKENDEAKKAFEKAKKGDESDEPEFKVSDVVSNEIKAYAGGDAEKERVAKEAMAMISFSGLKTAEAVKERMAAGYKLIPNYDPKQQRTPMGGAPGAGGAGSGRFDSIINDVAGTAKKPGDWSY